LANCRHVEAHKNGESWEFKGIFPDFKAFDPSCANQAESFLKMQLLDYITGQVDRHPKNYFITAEGTLQLIDNDCAFGVNAVPEGIDVRGQKPIAFVIDNNGSLMLRPPQVITADLKGAIDKMHANRVAVESVLSNYLAPAEVEATIKRLSQLYTHLNSEKVLIVNTKEELLSESAKKEMDSNNSYWVRELQIFDSSKTNLNHLRAHRE
jgi:hypothetical protein